jgi:hypothetical protein
MTSVIYSSDWPELTVNSVDEALEVGLDMNKYDDGTLSAALFMARWGMHPDANWVIVVNTDNG